MKSILAHCRFYQMPRRLVEQFVERLIDSSPEELQEEGILPIGSKEQWFSDLG